MACINRRTKVLTVRGIGGNARRELVSCQLKSTDRVIEVEISTLETKLGLSSMLGPQCVFDAEDESECPYFRAAP